MDLFKWSVFLDEHVYNGFHREDYFFAQICQCVIAVNSKDGKAPPIDQFLKKFTRERPKPNESKEAVRNRMAASRVSWAMLLGIDIPLDDLTEEMEPDEGDILPFTG